MSEKRYFVLSGDDYSVTAFEDFPLTFTYPIFDVLCELKSKEFDHNIGGLEGGN